LKLSTTYHPQTDGQLEALKKCIEMYLRFLPMKILRNGINYYHGQNFGTTLPFKAVYDREPPQLIKYTINNQDPTNVKDLLV